MGRTQVSPLAQAWETAVRDSALWMEAVASLRRGWGLGLGLPLSGSQECKEPGAGPEPGTELIESVRAPPEKHPLGVI